MYIPMEEFKVDLERVMKERQEPMNHLIAGYDAIREADERDSKVWNITNIQEAQNQMLVETNSPEQATDAIQKLSAIVLQLTERLDGKGGSV